MLTAIRRYQEQAVTDPAAALDDLARERKALTAAVRGKLDPADCAHFDELLRLAQAAARAREDHAFWIEGQTTGALRRICAEFGRRMTTAGILEDPAEVAMVTVDELLRFGCGVAQPHLRAQVPLRRAEHEQNLRHRPAPWLGAPPDEEEEPAAPETAPVLEGIAISPGVARGPARVAATLAEAASLRKGEVLICRETDPNWTPLFALAGAIVLDSFAGGMLGHAAIVAREYRLPAVARVGTAMARVRTGQMVEVDGDKGVVRIL